MTDRQEATRKALQWAYRADRAACDYRATSSDDPLSDRHAAVGQQARETATMWASIARLLPAVLDQTEPEPCDHERPDLGTVSGGTRCILPTGHRLPHRDHTGTSWNPGQQCRNHHAFDDYEERCERTAGHHGIHTARGLQWSNPRSDQTNAAPTTSHSSPEPATISLPGQRPNTEDAQPRCLSRYQAADGVERCERDAGHPGIHQGVTVGWRTEQAIIGPDYATADRCPSRFLAAGAVEGCAEPAGHIGPHRGVTCQWFSVHAIPADEPEPTVVEPSCCETAVRAAAAHLRVHARTAPGLTAYERRCLEDAVDFLTHHATREQP